MGLGSLGPRGRIPAVLEPAQAPPRPGPVQEPIGDDYRYDGLWEDLPREQMREGVAMLVARFGEDDAKRFIDTLTRARMKQIAFNGTDTALRAAAEYAPHVANAAKHVGTWAKGNPVVLGGLIGSAASVAFSYLSHKRKLEGQL